MTRIVHRKSGEPGRRQKLGPYEIEALIDRDQTGAISAYQIRIAPNATTAVSFHKQAEEIYWVLSGSGAAMLNGQTYPLSAGDFLRLPPGTTHGFSAGPDGLVMLDLHTPGCFPDHDTYFVGPPPEGFGRG